MPGKCLTVAADKSASLRADLLLGEEGDSPDGSTLVIVLAQNRLVLPGGTAVRLRRAWAAHFLALLLGQAERERSLGVDLLHNELLRRGHNQTLSRMVLARLVDELEATLGTIPTQPWTLHYARGNKTVGPWRIQWQHHAMSYRIDTPAATQFSVEGHAATSDTNSARAYPAVTHDANHETLCLILMRFRQSDSFAIHGDWSRAIQTLRPVFDLPLTAEALAVANLRLALCHKRQGHFDDARQCIRLVLDVASESFPDPGLLNYARFFLLRCDYDEEPTASYERLWNLGEAPEFSRAADIRVMPEWHGLRALLARRKLEAIRSRSIVNRITAPDQDEVSHLHRYALRHHEAAIYWALSLRNWDHLQASMTNLALHLQTTIPLGLVTIAQVFNWHSSVFACTCELGVGGDTAWHYIFLGEFWLDHEDGFEEVSSSVCSEGFRNMLVDDHHPANESFYIAAVNRLAACGDKRQSAIAWITYARYANKHCKEATRRHVAAKLRHVIAHDAPLQKTLWEEGYGDWLAGNC